MRHIIRTPEDGGTGLLPRATKRADGSGHKEHKSHKDHEENQLVFLVIFVTFVILVARYVGASQSLWAARYLPGEKQYSRPAPPVDTRFGWLQPRLGCTAFHEAFGPPRRS